MPRKLTGNAYAKRGKFYARITLGPKLRPAIPLPACATQLEADARAELLSGLAARLRKAGQLEQAVDVLKRGGEAAQGKPLDAVLRLVEQLERGEWTRKPSGAPTIEDLGKRWTSGDLARDWPDYIKPKKSAGDDVTRLELYVYPVLRGVRLDAFTLAHAEKVMRGIPAERSAATRRHVAQLLHRLLAMAVYPLKLIPSSPLPRGFLPKLGDEKAKGYVFPDEDRALLAARVVPLAWRVAYGVLHREGFRFGELARLAWRDLDLERGSVTLDVTKTGRAGFWALSPGVASALAAWKAHREAQRADVGPDAPVFVDEEDAALDPRAKNAERYREHLRAAGIERAALFASTAARRQIRAHDTRASFITIATANGRNEAWITTRSGHTSSAMLARYRRQAATAAELALGDWTPLDAAIPELGPPGGKGTGKGTKGGKGERRGPTGGARSPSIHGEVHEEGLEPSSLAAPEPKSGAYASSATRAHGLGPSCRCPAASGRVKTAGSYHGRGPRLPGL
jgi:integrase